MQRDGLGKHFKMKGCDRSKAASLLLLLFLLELLLLLLLDDLHVVCNHFAVQHFEGLAILHDGHLQVVLARLGDFKESAYG